MNHSHKHLSADQMHEAAVHIASTDPAAGAFGALSERAVLSAPHDGHRDPALGVFESLHDDLDPAVAAYERIRGERSADPESEIFALIQP